MNQITALNSDFKQSTNIILDDGSQITFFIRYAVDQQGWFYSLQYGSFILENRRLVVSPNMLRAFRNIIPFGLCCTSSDGYEPLYQSDFVVNRIKVYSLNPQDVLAAEVLIGITIPAALNEFRN